MYLPGIFVLCSSFLDHKVFTISVSARVLFSWMCLFSGNHDTQRSVEGQNILSDDELKCIPLTKRELLGRGAFGTVYRYENKDCNVEIAMKQFDCLGNKRLIDSLHQEIQILSKLKHNRIVRYYGIRQDKESVSILMEYAKGGTLRKLISDKGALCEKDVSKYCQQILEGLVYIHEMKIIHRDLKCDNILLDDFYNCKLTDFGISKDAENVRSTSGAETDCGSVYWKSPECIQGIKYGWKSDIWSFGCTVLEMLNKEPPNRKLKAVAAMWKIVHNKMDLDFPSGTSDRCILFTKLCLKKNPNFRPSAKELLSHSFISI